MVDRLGVMARLELRLGTGLGRVVELLRDGRVLGVRLELALGRRVDPPGTTRIPEERLGLLLLIRDPGRVAGVVERVGGALARLEAVLERVEGLAARAADGLTRLDGVPSRRGRSSPGLLPGRELGVPARLDRAVDVPGRTEEIPPCPIGAPGRVDGWPGWPVGVPGRVDGMPGWPVGVPGRVLGRLAWPVGVPGRVAGPAVRSAPGRLPGRALGVLARLVGSWACPAALRPPPATVDSLRPARFPGLPERIGLFGFQTVPRSEVRESDPRPVLPARVRVGRGGFQSCGR